MPGRMQEGQKEMTSDGAVDRDSVSALDVCECGDYRRDHIDGTGRCTMADDACHGFKPCFEFRLHYRETNERQQ